ncbi:RsiV family protein [Patescibacteria group bacterium]|nr:RsiV family protein [Patescibacteria group bacterium]
MEIKNNFDYKKIKPTIVLLVVLLLGSLGYWLGQNRSSYQPGQNLSYVTKTIEEGTDQTSYYVKVAYPFFTAEEVDSTILNELAYQAAVKQITTFKQELSDWDGARVSPEDFYSSSLNVDYDLKQATTILVSWRFNISNYLTGAAHPNSFSETVNYSVKDKKIIELADLFKSQTNYLEILSSLAILNLASQPDLKDDDGLSLTLIKQGAAPTLANFSKFTIQPVGLELYFDPYQVAAYAAGLRTVIIPWIELEGVLSNQVRTLVDIKNNL